MKPDLYNLSIDRSFSKLWLLPPPKEARSLEPILTYGQTIVSGFSAYEFYHRHKIPFTYEERRFYSINEAVTYSCLESLKRTDLTDEQFRYCVGRLYIAQKNLLSENYPMQNQCMPQPPVKNQSRYTTAALVPSKRTLSHSTVYKYSLYSAAVDEIDRKAPGLTAKILQGSFKLSHNDTLALSKLTPEEIRAACHDMTDRRVQSKPARHAEQKASGLCAKIKQMPEYDPNAEISSLTLTIPMWIGCVNRTKSLAKFHEASTDALRRLEEQLIELNQCIEKMQMKIQEEYHE